MHHIYDICGEFWRRLFLRLKYLQTPSVHVPDCSVRLFMGPDRPLGLLDWILLGWFSIIYGTSDVLYLLVSNIRHEIIELRSTINMFKFDSAQTRLNCVSYYIWQNWLTIDLLKFKIWMIDLSYEFN